MLVLYLGWHTKEKVKRNVGKHKDLFITTKEGKQAFLILVFILRKSVKGAPVKCAKLGYTIQNEKDIKYRIKPII